MDGDQDHPDRARTNKNNAGDEKKNNKKQYFAMRLLDFDLHWKVKADHVEVLELRPASDNKKVSC